MMPLPKSYTAAMAKLYADQGYLRKAAEIYRHLICRHPERIDLPGALADIERQIAQRPSPTPKDIELLLREWIAMVKKAKDMERNGSERRRKSDAEENL
ncbi:MAG: hypothetical protein C4519_03110 [Desulfobacteraceae bacterium]|nr:MAG: hypothetical protein C4519_03110 [Desulfobacteraceae bacterium]